MYARAVIIKSDFIVTWRNSAKASFGHFVGVTFVYDKKNIIQTLCDSRKLCDKVAATFVETK